MKGTITIATHKNANIIQENNWTETHNNILSTKRKGKKKRNPRTRKPIDQIRNRSISAKGPKPRKTLISKMKIVPYQLALVEKSESDNSHGGRRRAASCDTESTRSSRTESLFCSGTWLWRPWFYGLWNLPEGLNRNGEDGCGGAQISEGRVLGGIWDLGRKKLKYRACVVIDWLRLTGIP